jgi:hypothetical protein
MMVRMGVTYGVFEQKRSVKEPKNPWEASQNAIR